MFQVYDLVEVVSIIISVAAIFAIIKYRLLPFGLMVDAGGDGSDDNSHNQNNEPKTYSLDEFKKVVQQRDESKQRASELTTQVDEAQALLENRTKELDDIKKKLTEAETKLTEKSAQLETIETETRKELLQNLTKEQKEFCKNKPVSEIRQFVKLLKANAGSEPDSGGSLVNKNDIKLTDIQKKEAEGMGLSEDLYIEYIQERDKRKPKK